MTKKELEAENARLRAALERIIYLGSDESKELIESACESYLAYPYMAGQMQAIAEIALKR